jgi:hypothetical protein
MDWGFWWPAIVLGVLAAGLIGPVVWASRQEKMNWRRYGATFVVALLALGMIALVVYGLPGKEEEEAEEADLYSLDYIFPGSEFVSVASLSVTDHETGQTLSAEAEGDVWEVTEAPEGTDLSLEVDNIRLQSAGMSLTSLTSQREIGELESLEPFGLDSARYTIRFTLSDGKTFTLHVGDMSPDQVQYYVQRSDQDVIHLVSSFGLDSVLMLVGDPPLLEPTPTPMSEAGEVTPSPTP